MCFSLILKCNLYGQSTFHQQKYIYEFLLKPNIWGNFLNFFNGYQMDELLEYREHYLIIFENVSMSVCQSLCEATFVAALSQELLH